MADGLTATPQAGLARVLLRLEWAGTTLADIVRVHPDSTTSPVRNAEPAYVNTTWVGYDHEAPLDTTVTYRASSVGVVLTDLVSSAVNLASGPLCWLKHPGKPWLNRTVRLRELGPRVAPARRGVLRPLDRADPIIIHTTRSSDSGYIVLNLATVAERSVMAEMLADGAALLLQTPASWGGESLYISVDTTDLRPVMQWGPDPLRRLSLPFDVMGRPPGAAGGPAGLRWDDVPPGVTWNTATGTWDDKATAL
jgi:hypothetical protein